MMYSNDFKMVFSKAFYLLMLLAVLSACHTGREDLPGGDLLVDVDGNRYSTIAIGNQVWMAEDLKTTRYYDGTPIPRVENYDEWAELTLPAYSWYNNDTAKREEFGALYNFYAVETGKLCPEGWHVPSDEEWIILESSLGGASNAGGALKEAGTDHWKTPNTGASNESGFTALPGGYRSYNGTFNWMRTYGLWWSSSEKSWYGGPPRVIYRDLRYDGQDMRRNISDKASGLSVRCIKNP